MAHENKTAKQIAAAKYRAAHRAKIAAYRRAWRQTEAGKAARKAERNSKAGKAAALRHEQTDKRKAARAKYRTKRKDHRQRQRAERVQRFVGCDGEGVGSGPAHKFVLFRMGHRELYDRGRKLKTAQLLKFITDHPSRNDVLVGFAFEYDITSILIDATPKQRQKLIDAYAQPTGAAKKSPYWTWLRFDGLPAFGVNWLARNHLEVCIESSSRPRKAAKGSIRRIYDTFGFFGKSFIGSLKAWDVGADRLALIEKLKPQRSTFTTITQEIRDYNKLECDLLAELMEKFRSTCEDCDLHPRTWNGAGKIASFLHRTHGTVRAKDLAKLVPKGVLRMAHAAYYGGRFEITRAGRLPMPVWEHDINSAYPAAMQALPCLLHGDWTKEPGEKLGALLHLDPDAIFVAPVRFAYHHKQFLCGFPFRDKTKGGLSWPRLGNGVYWSNEILSGLQLGATITLRSGWLYHRRCDCSPFAWVNERYLQRKALGKKGEPIKLGLNSLYGKLAQRIGDPPYRNPIHAGLITAACRSQLNDAIRCANDPRDIVMIATDGIYTVNHMLSRLPAGDALGTWKITLHDSLFIMQPGFYWGPGDLTKSRGLSTATVDRYRAEIESAWDAYCKKYGPRDSRATMRAYLDDAAAAYASGDRVQSAKLEAFAFRERFPAINIEFPAFIGLRAAAHMKQPHLAGTWQTQQRKLSFDWSAKRSGYAEGFSADLSHIVTKPLPGAALLVSQAYNESSDPLESSAQLELERLINEAHPDADLCDEED